jgi:hypothetical protein
MATPERERVMKTLAVVTAALAISLTFARIASADSVSITRTSVDAFGDRNSVIQNTRTGIDAFGNRRSFHIISKDAFGNQRSVIQNNSDNGFVRCQTVTLRSADAVDDSASRTMRRCAPDF